MLVSLLVIFGGFLVTSLATSPTTYNGRTFKNALTQQALQTVLQSIEERLRNLDQIYSTRYASANINSDQFIRKIEILENKLSRMETQMEVQLEKISENMSTKNFKDDVIKDQIFRKIDSIYERINHKLSYVEGKVDMDNLKLQTKIESVISKIERLDHSFSVRQADMEAEFSDAIEIMENVKNNVASVENKLMNITKNTIESSFQQQTEVWDTKFDSFSNLLTQFDSKINDSLRQCNQKDVQNDYTNKDVHLSKTFKGYEDQIQTYGNKVNNMYNELWKKSTTIENTMKRSVLLMDLARKDIQDLKKDGHKFTAHDSQNDGQLEVIVDSFTNTIQRKFSELGRKLESNFENVMLIQNLFLESCHRIQMDENQLENQIGLVLEKLLDAVTNRSINTFKEIQSMEELIKSHDTNVYQTLNENSNKIIKLSEKTSEDRKKLEKILSTMKKDIGNIVETVQNIINSEEQQDNQKYDTIANLLLELQEQVNDLDSRVNEENINYNAKQTLQDILQATKNFPTKDTYLQNLTTSVEDLSDLIRNIYHLLTSDTRINNSMDYKHHVDSEMVINNTTKDQEIANFRAEDNRKIHSAVTEPMQVLEIFPEVNDGNERKNSTMSRFNYTLVTEGITDNNLENENITFIPTLFNVYKYLFIVKNNKVNESDTVIQQAFSDIPEVSTISNTLVNQFNHENNNNIQEIVSDLDTKLEESTTYSTETPLNSIAISIASTTSNAHLDQFNDDNNNNNIEETRTNFDTSIEESITYTEFPLASTIASPLQLLKYDNNESIKTDLQTSQDNINSKIDIESKATSANKNIYSPNSKSNKTGPSSLERVRSIEMTENIAPKGFKGSVQSAYKNESNIVTSTELENDDNSTYTPISSTKIENFVAYTTDGTILEFVENSTLVNFDESKNSTNEDYDWDYDD